MAMKKSISYRNWDLPSKLKTLTANGYEIAFIERGQGIPVVLIHGSLSDYRSWSLQMESFSKSFRTIALSLRHCYPEPWDGEGDNFTVRQHVDDTAAFVKNIQAGPVHLVGHSRGGSVALILAAEHPELFRTAVLVDPAPLEEMFPGSPEVAAELEKRKTFVIEAVDFIKQGDMDKGLEIFTDAVSINGTWKKLPEAVKQIRRENAWSLKSLVTDAQEPFNYKHVKKMDMPVLLVTGEKSPSIYRMMHAALEKSLKNFRKTMIPKASHGMHTDNPKAFNTAVLDFLIS